MEFLDLLAAHPPLFIGCCALMGLLVGSFLNVVIHRLPKMLERDWDAQAADLLEQHDLAEPAARLRGDANRAAYNLVVPPSTCPHRYT